MRSVNFQMTLPHTLLKTRKGPSVKLCFYFLFFFFFIKVAVLNVEIEIEIFKKKVIYLNFSIFPSVQFSRSVMSDPPTP